MKEYIVSLNVVASPSVTGSNVADLLGLDPHALSSRPQHDATLLWRYEPAAPETATLGDRIGHIASQVKPKHPVRLDERIKGIYLDIGVLYDSLTCSVAFEARGLEPLMEAIPNLGVEITSYPCAEEDAHERTRQR